MAKVPKGNYFLLISIFAWICFLEMQILSGFFIYLFIYFFADCIVAHILNFVVVKYVFFTSNV